ncbi:MAG: phage tail tape measure protein [Deferribacterales bacterium]
MKEFGISFVIGAVLGGSFKTSIGTVEEKVKALDGNVGSLGKTMKQIDSLRSLDESLIKNKGGLEKARADLAALEPRLAEIRGKYTALSDAVKSADVEMAASKANYEQVRNRVSSLKIELQNTDTSTDELKNALASANRELAQSKLRFDESKTAMSKAKAELSAITPEMKELDQAHKKATSNVDMFENTIKKESRSVVELGEALKKAKVDTANLDAEQKKLAATLEKQKARKEKLGSLMETRDNLADQRSRLNGLVLGAAASVGTLSIPMKLSMEKEDFMLDVSKNVKGLDTAADMHEMEMEVRKIGRSSLLGAEGVAKLVAEAGMIGMAKNDAIQFAGTAEKMATAFGLSADEAGASISKIKATMGLSLGEISSLGDAINYVGDNTASSAASITNMLQRNGGLLKSTTGLASAQIAALSAAFDAAAPNTEMAATAQKNFILTMTSGAAATSAQRDSFKALGLSAEDMAERMQTDATGAIKEVFDALNQLSDADRGATMAELFGKESVGPIAGLMGNMKEFEKTMGLVADKTRYAGSMQSEYERKMGTAGTSSVKMKNSMKEIGYVIGDILLPPLATVFGVIGSLAVRFGDFAAANPRVTKTVVGLAVGLGVGLTAVVAFGYGINIIRTGLVYTRIALISTSMATGKFGSIASITGMRMAVVSGATKAWAAAQWLLNAAMSANPIGAIIVGVGALIAIGVVLYKKWTPFRLMVNRIWNGMKQFGGIVGMLFPIAGLGTFLYKKWEPFRKLIDGVGGGIKKVGGFVGKLFGFGKGDKAEEQKKAAPQVGRTARMIAPNRQATPDKMPAQQAQPRNIPITPYKMPAQQGGGQQKQVNITVKSSPTIVVQGGSVDAAKAALAGHHDDLARKIKKMQEEKSRVSYE